MTAAQPESSHYYVYVCRIGGVMRYVGKGSGYRKNRHKKTSHNPQLRALLAHAEENDVPLQFRVIKSDLTNTEALRLEGRCFEKWLPTLLNKNNPRRANLIEQMQSEWEAVEEEAEAMLGYPTKRLEALYEFEAGTLPHAKALEWGVIEPDQSEAQSRG